MADNYLERKQEEYLARKAAADKAKRLAWKKRMDAYRKKLAATEGVSQDPARKEGKTEGQA